MWTLQISTRYSWSPIPPIPAVSRKSELGSALVNADYSAFDPYTIKMMMRMFSTAPRLDFVTYEGIRRSLALSG
jgi:hypothetical protein